MDKKHTSQIPVYKRVAFLKLESLVPFSVVNGRRVGKLSETGHGGCLLWIPAKPRAHTYRTEKTETDKNVMENRALVGLQRVHGRVERR